MATTARSADADSATPEYKRNSHTTVAEADEDSFDRDLHGDNRAGQHGGTAAGIRAYTAYDVKELHAAMPDFTNEDLKRIPVLAHGERLEQGGAYLDLNDRATGEFTAQGNFEAQDPNRYVPKSAVGFDLWNKLTGVSH
jgi:hypothetical protein